MIVQWVASLLLLVLAWLSAVIALLSLHGHEGHKLTRVAIVLSIVCLLAAFRVRP